MLGVLPTGPPPAGGAGPDPSRVTDLRLLYAGTLGSQWRANASVHTAAAGLHDVSVTGQHVPISPITTSDVEHTLLPLALWIAKQCAGRRRLLVGITGPGGAGKSVTCEVLATCLRALPVDCFGSGREEYSSSEYESEEDTPPPLPLGDAGVVVLGVDAFHYPNEYLTENEAVLHSGQRRALKVIKGTPPTMDCAALLRTLRNLRDSSIADVLTTQLPYYDRNAHDPRPEGPVVRPQTRLVRFVLKVMSLLFQMMNFALNMMIFNTNVQVLVEGVHLLHDDGPWSDLREVLHCCIHLDTSSIECRKRLISRKSAPGAGKTVAQATAHYQLVDRQNVRAHQVGSNGLPILYTCLAIDRSL